MTRSLVLVVSAFNALIALGALAHDLLSPSAAGGAAMQMLGVVVASALCWLRWRAFWHNTFLVPALIVGAAMLISFALLGLGEAVRLSSIGNVGGSSLNVLDLLLGAQGGLMFLQLFNDRSHSRRDGPADDGAGPDVP